MTVRTARGDETRREILVAAADLFHKQGVAATSPGEDHLADFCLATIQGAMLMGKVKRSSQLAESVVHEAMAHLRRYATQVR
jgi:hypothetical protein